MISNLIIFALACANLYFAVVNRSVLNWVIAGLCFGCAFVEFFKIMNQNVLVGF